MFYVLCFYFSARDIVTLYSPRRGNDITMGYRNIYHKSKPANPDWVNPSRRRATTPWRLGNWHWSWWVDMCWLQTEQTFFRSLQDFVRTSMWGLKWRTASICTDEGIRSGFQLRQLWDCTNPNITTWPNNSLHPSVIEGRSLCLFRNLRPKTNNLGWYNFVVIHSQATYPSHPIASGRQNYLRLISA